ncbi:MAG: hypothetical protein CVV27_02400 [Candidatus Melainabacteria bacterium HGW-Melainabacteria-1]|nr:MAG: hypothetical protein CVV27_02400 [Candidatus Melainabacteria bacterium HGW-Melainabacteria-1]
MTTDSLPFGGTLVRKHVGPSPDELGAPAFWAEPIHQMYAQHPFQAYQQGRRITAWHMDHPELDSMTAAKIANLQDFDPNVPGCQVAAGLCWPDPPESKGIEMGVFPAGWQPEYTGPARYISEQARRDARKTYSHEEGHRYFGKSRTWRNEDDISRLSTQRFLELRPRQAGSEFEDAAEVYRAVMGSDECRGYYSDGTTASISPELRSLVRCLFWLSANLKGAWVASLVPGPAGCMYQLWVGFGWEWRWVSASDWHTEKWTGSAWVRI